MYIPNEYDSTWSLALHNVLTKQATWRDYEQLSHCEEFPVAFRDACRERARFLQRKIDAQRLSAEMEARLDKAFAVDPFAGKH